MLFPGFFLSLFSPGDPVSIAFPALVWEHSLIVLYLCMLLSNCCHIVPPWGELNIGSNIDLWNCWFPWVHASFILCLALMKGEWCCSWNALAVFIWLFFYQQLILSWTLLSDFDLASFLYLHGLSYCIYRGTTLHSRKGNVTLEHFPLLSFS